MRLGSGREARFPCTGRSASLPGLMRWSGLAIQDAVTFERDRLSDDDKLFLYQAKTGVPVHVPVPPDVAAMIRGSRVAIRVNSSKSSIFCSCDLITSASC